MLVERGVSPIAQGLMCQAKDWSFVVKENGGLTFYYKKMGDIVIGVFYLFHPG